MKFFSRNGGLSDKFGSTQDPVAHAIATGDIAAMARFAEEARAAEGQRTQIEARAIDPRTIKGI